MDSKIINTREHLLAWAKAANNCSDTATRVNLQDIYGRSTFKTVLDIYLNQLSPGDYGLVNFAFYKIEGEETWQTFVRAFARRICDELIAEREEKLAEADRALAGKKEEFEDIKMSMHRRIGKYRREAADKDLTITHLRRENARLEKELHDLSQGDAEIKKKAERFDKLCELLDLPAKAT